MIGFYESQLIALTAFCLLTLTVERCLSKSNRTELSRELGAHNHVENGSLKGRGPLAALTRQYLVVYAIVMGELSYFS
jgi:MFS transporter, MFS domain-containing protein family, molybdate-anion transporter